MPIEELQVSARLLQLLKRAGCRSVADVASRWPGDILRVNRIGPVSMQELQDKLGQVIPDLLPAPPSLMPRRQTLVTAQSFRDHKGGKWDRDGIRLLRMFVNGLTTRQIAEEQHCSLSAVYARKRRLLLHYVHPAQRQRLPEDLQGFVVTESKKVPRATLARQSQRGDTPAEYTTGGLPRGPQQDHLRP